jgi:hypothetical protein
VDCVGHEPCHQALNVRIVRSYWTRVVVAPKRDAFLDVVY